MSFNPHTHAGCDATMLIPSPQDRVSIHTPTQGVTLISLTSLAILKFQSTHPRRVWQQNTRSVCYCQCFNPHTHAGCDVGRLRHISSIKSFQSTHPRRVWPWSGQTIHGDYGFQSTHPRRVWPSAFPLNSRYSGFNPHTHAGCDIDLHDALLSAIEFQSTHPRRVWPQCLSVKQQI